MVKFAREAEAAGWAVALRAGTVDAADGESSLGVWECEASGTAHDSRQGGESLAVLSLMWTQEDGRKRWTFDTERSGAEFGGRVLTGYVTLEDYRRTLSQARVRQVDPVAEAAETAAREAAERAELEAADAAQRAEYAADAAEYARQWERATDQQAERFGAWAADSGVLWLGDYAAAWRTWSATESAAAEAYAAVMAECRAHREEISRLWSVDRMEREHVPHGAALAHEVAESATREVKTLMARAAKAEGTPGAADMIRREVLPALVSAREALEAYDAHRSEETREHTLRASADADQVRPAVAVPQRDAAADAAAPVAPAASTAASDIDADAVARGTALVNRTLSEIEWHRDAPESSAPVDLVTLAREAAGRGWSVKVGRSMTGREGLGWALSLSGEVAVPAGGPVTVVYTGMWTGRPKFHRAVKRVGSTRMDRPLMWPEFRKVVRTAELVTAAPEADQGDAPQAARAAARGETIAREVVPRAGEDSHSHLGESGMLGAVRVEQGAPVAYAADVVSDPGGVDAWESEGGVLEGAGRPLLICHGKGGGVFPVAFRGPYEGTVRLSRDVRLHTVRGELAAARERVESAEFIAQERAAWSADMRELEREARRSAGVLGDHVWLSAEHAGDWRTHAYDVALAADRAARNARDAVRALEQEESAIVTEQGLAGERVAAAGAHLARLHAGEVQAGRGAWLSEDGEAAMVFTLPWDASQDVARIPGGVPADQITGYAAFVDVLGDAVAARDERRALTAKDVPGRNRMGGHGPDTDLRRAIVNASKGLDAKPWKAPKVPETGTPLDAETLATWDTVGDVVAETEAAPGVWLPMAAVSLAEVSMANGWTVAMQRDGDTVAVRVAGAAVKKGKPLPYELLAVWVDGVWSEDHSAAWVSGRRVTAKRALLWSAPVKVGRSGTHQEPSLLSTVQHKAEPGTLGVRTPEWSAPAPAGVSDPGSTEGWEGEGGALADGETAPVDDPGVYVGATVDGGQFMPAIPTGRREELPPPAIRDEALSQRAYLFNAGKAGLWVHVTGPRDEHTSPAEHMATSDSIAAFAVASLTPEAADAVLSAHGWERRGAWDSDNSAPVTLVPASELRTPAAPTPGPAPAPATPTPAPNAPTGEPTASSGDRTEKSPEEITEGATVAEEPTDGEPTETSAQVLAGMPRNAGVLFHEAADRGWDVRAERHWTGHAWVRQIVITGLVMVPKGLEEVEHVAAWSEDKGGYMPSASSAGFKDVRSAVAAQMPVSREAEESGRTVWGRDAATWVREMDTAAAKITAGLADVRDAYNALDGTGPVGHRAVEIAGAAYLEAADAERRAVDAVKAARAWLADSNGEDARGCAAWRRVIVLATKRVTDAAERIAGAVDRAECEELAAPVIAEAQDRLNAQETAWRERLAAEGRTPTARGYGSLIYMLEDSARDWAAWFDGYTDNNGVAHDPQGDASLSMVAQYDAWGAERAARSNGRQVSFPSRYTYASNLASDRQSAAAVAFALAVGEYIAAPDDDDVSPMGRGTRALLADIAAVRRNPKGFATANERKHLAEWVTYPHGDNYRPGAAGFAEHAPELWEAYETAARAYAGVQHFRHALVWDRKHAAERAEEIREADAEGLASLTAAREARRVSGREAEEWAAAVERFTTARVRVNEASALAAGDVERAEACGERVRESDELADDVWSAVRFCREAYDDVHSAKRDADHYAESAEVYREAGRLADYVAECVRMEDAAQRAESGREETLNLYGCAFEDATRAEEARQTACAADVAGQAAAVVEVIAFHQSPGVVGRVVCQCGAVHAGYFPLRSRGLRGEQPSGMADLTDWDIDDALAARGLAASADRDQWSRGVLVTTEDGTAGFATRIPVTMDRRAAEAYEASRAERQEVAQAAPVEEEVPEVADEPETAEAGAAPPDLSPLWASEAVEARTQAIEFSAKGTRQPKGSPVRPVEGERGVWECGGRLYSVSHNGRDESLWGDGYPNTVHDITEVRARRGGFGPAAPIIGHAHGTADARKLIRMYAREVVDLIAAQEAEAGEAARQAESGRIASLSGAELAAEQVERAHGMVATVADAVGPSGELARRTAAAELAAAEAHASRYDTPQADAETDGQEAVGDVETDVHGAQLRAALIEGETIAPVSFTDRREPSAGWILTTAGGHTFRLRPVTYSRPDENQWEAGHDGDGSYWWAANLDDRPLTAVLARIREDSATRTRFASLWARYGHLTAQAPKFETTTDRVQLEEGVYLVRRFGSIGLIASCRWGWEHLTDPDGAQGRTGEDWSRKGPDNRQYVAEWKIWNLAQGAIPNARLRVVAQLTDDMTGTPDAYCDASAPYVGKCSAKRSGSRYTVAVVTDQGAELGRYTVCARCLSHRLLNEEDGRDGRTGHRDVQSLAQALAKGDPKVCALHWQQWPDRIAEVAGQMLSAALDAGEVAPWPAQALADQIIAEACEAGDDRAKREARAEVKAAGGDAKAQKRAAEEAAAARQDRAALVAGQGAAGRAFSARIRAESASKETARHLEAGDRAKAEKAAGKASEWAVTAIEAAEAATAAGYGPTEDEARADMEAATEAARAAVATLTGPAGPGAEGSDAAPEPAEEAPGVVDVNALTVTPQDRDGEPSRYEFTVTGPGLTVGEYKISHDCQGKDARGIMWRAYWHGVEPSGRWDVISIGSGEGKGAALAAVAEHAAETGGDLAAGFAAARRMHYDAGLWILPDVGESETIEYHPDGSWTITAETGARYTVRRAWEGRDASNDLAPLLVEDEAGALVASCTAVDGYMSAWVPMLERLRLHARAVADEVQHRAAVTLGGPGQSWVEAWCVCGWTERADVAKFADRAPAGEALALAHQRAHDPQMSAADAHEFGAETEHAELSPSAIHDDAHTPAAPAIPSVYMAVPAARAAAVDLAESAWGVECDRHGPVTVWVDMHGETCPQHRAGWCETRADAEHAAALHLDAHARRDADVMTPAEIERAEALNWSAAQSDIVNWVADGKVGEYPDGFFALDVAYDKPDVSRKLNRNRVLNLWASGHLLVDLDTNGARRFTLSPETEAARKLYNQARRLRMIEAAVKDNSFGVSKAERDAYPLMSERRTFDGEEPWQEAPEHDVRIICHDGDKVSAYNRGHSLRCVCGWIQYRPEADADMAERLAAEHVNSAPEEAPEAAPVEELRAYMFNAGKAGLFVHVTGPRQEHVNADEHVATSASVESFKVEALTGADADAALAAAGWERSGPWDEDRSAPVQRATPAAEADPAPVVLPAEPLTLIADPVRPALPAGESAETSGGRTRLQVLEAEEPRPARHAPKPQEKPKPSEGQQEQGALFDLAQPESQRPVTTPDNALEQDETATARMVANRLPDLPPLPKLAGLSHQDKEAIRRIRKDYEQIRESLDGIRDGNPPTADAREDLRRVREQLDYIAQRLTGELLGDHEQVSVARAGMLDLGTDLDEALQTLPDRAPQPQGDGPNGGTLYHPWDLQDGDLVSFQADDGVNNRIAPYYGTFCGASSTSGSRTLVSYEGREWNEDRQQWENRGIRHTVTMPQRGLVEKFTPEQWDAWRRPDQTSNGSAAADTSTDTAQVPDTPIRQTSPATMAKVDGADAGDSPNVTEVGTAGPGGDRPTTGEGGSSDVDDQDGAVLDVRNNSALNPLEVHASGPLVDVDEDAASGPRPHPVLTLGEAPPAVATAPLEDSRAPVPRARPADTLLRPGRLLHADGTSLVLHQSFPGKAATSHPVTAHGAAPAPFGTGEWQVVLDENGSRMVVHPALISRQGTPRYPGVEDPEEVARWAALDGSEASGEDVAVLPARYVRPGDRLAVTRSVKDKEVTEYLEVTRLRSHSPGEQAGSGLEFTLAGPRGGTRRVTLEPTAHVTIAHPTTHPAVTAPADGRPITTRLLRELWAEGPQIRQVHDPDTLKLIADGQFALHQQIDRSWELLPATTATVIWPSEYIYGFDGEPPWPLAGFPDADEAKEFANRLTSVLCHGGPGTIDFASPDFPVAAQTWRTEYGAPLYLALLGERADFDRSHGRADSHAATEYLKFEAGARRPQAPAGHQWADQLESGDLVLLEMDDELRLFDIRSRTISKSGLVKLVLDTDDTVLLARNMTVPSDTTRPVTANGVAYADLQAGWAVPEGAWVELDPVDLDPELQRSLEHPQLRDPGSRIRAKLSTRDDDTYSIRLSQIRLVTAAQERHTLAQDLVIEQPDLLVRLHPSTAAAEEAPQLPSGQTLTNGSQGPSPAPAPAATSSRPTALPPTDQLSGAASTGIGAVRSEGDTPAPEAAHPNPEETADQQAATPATLAPRPNPDRQRRAQEIADAATAATRPEQVRELWEAARSESLPPDTPVETPDGTKPLRSYLTVRGQDVAARTAATDATPAAEHPAPSPDDTPSASDTPERPEPHNAKMAEAEPVQEKAALYELANSVLGSEQAPAAPTVLADLNGITLYHMVSAVPPEAADAQVGSRWLYLGLTDDTSNPYIPIAVISDADLSRIPAPDFEHAVSTWAHAAEPGLVNLSDTAAPVGGRSQQEHHAAAAAAAAKTSDEPAPLDERSIARTARQKLPELPQLPQPARRRPSEAAVTTERDRRVLQPYEHAARALSSVSEGHPVTGDAREDLRRARHFLGDVAQALAEYDSHMPDSAHARSVRAQLEDMGTGIEQALTTLPERRPQLLGDGPNGGALLHPWDLAGEDLISFLGRDPMEPGDKTKPYTGRFRRLLMPDLKWDELGSTPVQFELVTWNEMRGEWEADGLEHYATIPAGGLVERLTPAQWNAWLRPQQPAPAKLVDEREPVQDANGEPRPPSTSPAPDTVTPRRGARARGGTGESDETQLAAPRPEIAADADDDVRDGPAQDNDGDDMTERQRRDDSVASQRQGSTAVRPEPSPPRADLLQTHPAGTEATQASPTSPVERAPESRTEGADRREGVNAPPAGNVGTVAEKQGLQAAVSTTEDRARRTRDRHDRPEDHLNALRELFEALAASASGSSTSTVNASFGAPAAQETKPARLGLPPALTRARADLNTYIEAINDSPRTTPRLRTELGVLIAQIDQTLPQVNAIHASQRPTLLIRALDLLVRTAERLKDLAARLHAPAASQRIEQLTERLRGTRPQPAAPLLAPRGDQRLQAYATTQRTIETQLATPGLPLEQRHALQEEWLLNRARWHNHYKAHHGEPPEGLIPQNGNRIAGYPTTPSLRPRIIEELGDYLRRRARDLSSVPATAAQAELFVILAAAYEKHSPPTSPMSASLQPPLSTVRSKQAADRPDVRAAARRLASEATRRAAHTSGAALPPRTSDRTVATQSEQQRTVHPASASAGRGPSPT